MNKKRLFFRCLAMFVICLGLSIFIDSYRVNASTKTSITIEFNDGTKKKWKTGDKKISLGKKQIQYIYYGSYPQTEVIGEKLTKAIINANYNKNGVATVKGVKYKRISKDDANVSSFVSGGYNWTDKKYAYFKFEPIKWRVLSYENNIAFLLAESNLDNQFYNDTYKDVKWEDCSLRAWLNKKFYTTAFSTKERKLIKTSVINYDNGYYVTETKDKVFLLSIEDVENSKYGFSDSVDACEARSCQPTDYSWAMGTQRGNDVVLDRAKPYVFWWLRSNSSYSGTFKSVVNLLGEIKTGTQAPVNNYSYGYYLGSTCPSVRPAINLNLSTVIKSSAKTKNTENEKQKYLIEFSDGSQVSGLIGQDKMDIDYLYGKTISYIYFGSYPQTEVVGKELKDAIKNAKYDKNGIATVDGIKYKRLSANDVVYNGSEYADEGYYDWSTKEYAYFKYEPIKWRVINYNSYDVLQTGKIELVAELILDYQRYNNTIESVEWQSSDIRSWLNNAFFLVAFSENEENAVLESYLSDSGTSDKVFLSSFSDMTNSLNGYSVVGWTSSDTRQCCLTSYAIAMGAFANKGNEIAEGKYVGYYWLRTSATLGGMYIDGEFVNSEIEYVDFDGKIEENGLTCTSVMGIRPAMVIDAFSLIKS